MNYRNWTIWMPSVINIHVRHEGAAQITSSDRGPVYSPVETLTRLTREEAARVALNRHGPNAIITRRRGKPVAHAYRDDLLQR